MKADQSKLRYTAVSLRHSSGGYEICLDDKPIKTPHGSRMLVPSLDMAEGIADEWKTVEGEVDVNNCFYTRLACSALDEVGNHRDQVVQALMSHLVSDVMFFPADWPEQLVSQQEKCWDPILDWAQSLFGISVKCAPGFSFQPQAESVLKMIESTLQSYDDFELSAVWSISRTCSSLIIGLAVAEGAITADDAWRAGFLEEDWQRAQWGIDEEDKRRRKHIWNELAKATHVLQIHRALNGHTNSSNTVFPS